MIADSGRNPWEVSMFAAMLIVGAMGATFGSAQANSITANMPSWFVSVYYGTLAFWAGVGLIGLATRDIITRLKVERIACYGVGYAAMAYCISAFAYAGMNGLQASLGVGWISVAAVWRTLQIHRALKTIERPRDDIETCTQ